MVMFGTVLLVAAIGLQLLDLATTAVALRSKTAHEANPVLRWFFDRIGWVASLVALKLMVCALCVGLWAGGYVIALAVVVAAYLLVVVNNVLVLQRNANAK
jgi:hypothetical protein